MRNTFGKLLTTLSTALLVCSCAVNPVPDKKEVTVEYYDKTGTLVKKKKFLSDKAEITGNFDLVNKGSGNYLSVKKFRKRAQADSRSGGIKLNFENADIKEVVSIIIGKILNDNYLIDPAVKGVVNLRTVKDLNKNTAFYVLENILDIHGARIIRDDGHYRILPKNRTALGMVGMADDEPKARIGYGYRVVPLQYVSTSEMTKILESVTYKSSIIRSDEKRNLLILGGTSTEVKNMLDTVKLFDVDWMKGTSVGLIKIRYSNVADVVKDLNKMLKIDSATDKAKSFVSLEPIERLNSIMIITKRYDYIDRIRGWIAKLDVPEVGEGNKLYVYAVKHTNADAIATTLMELFNGESPTDIDSENDVLSPGSKPITLNIMSSSKDNKTADQQTSRESNVNGKSTSGIRIIPASDSNSLLIMATPGEYAKIEGALELLDIPPLQVLVEVTIMDVRLSDDLSYGMQWFFQSEGNYNTDTTVGDSLSFPQTFSYSAVKQTGNVIGLLGMLASEGKVNVLSSPSLLVRNNEKASISVGDQQPISTALVGPEGNVVASSVQFKDTGVILEIKPTVNTSGTVNVNIAQEVTDIGDIDDATGQRAFLRRSIKSAVSVADGETIILGGLIRSNKANVENGVPGLRDIPLLGYLFSKTVSTEQRTELIIMLTPKVIRNSDENIRVVDEYKRKFKNLFGASAR